MQLVHNIHGTPAPAPAPRHPLAYPVPQPYDPAPLLAQVQQQWPHFPGLWEAVQRIERVWMLEEMHFFVPLEQVFSVPALGQVRVQLPSGSWILRFGADPAAAHGLRVETLDLDTTEQT